MKMSELTPGTQVRYKPVTYGNADHPMHKTTFTVVSAKSHTQVELQDANGRTKTTAATRLIPA